MNTLSKILVEKLPSESVSFKKSKIVPINSTLLVVISIVATTVIIISLMRANECTYDLFSSVFQMLLGLYFLFFAPISKISGIGYRKFEIIVGSGLAVLAAALLVMNLFGC